MNTQGGPLEFEFDLDIKQLQSKLALVQTELSGVSTNLQKEGSKIDKAWAMGLAAIAGLAIGRFIGNTLRDIVAVRAEFEKLEAVLTNTFGNESKAKMALSMIQEFASKTPFQVTELTASFVKLVNQGFEPTMDDMTALGDIASSTGKSFDQLAEAILDAQTMQFERLKEFGIKAQKEGDKIIFTFKQQKTVVDANSDAIQKYILSLGKVEGVSGSMAAISKTMVGQISNMKDAWDQLLNALGNRTEGPIKFAIEQLGGLLTMLTKLFTSAEALRLQMLTQNAGFDFDMTKKEIEASAAAKVAAGMDQKQADQEALEEAKIRIADNINKWEQEVEKWKNKIESLKADGVTRDEKKQIRKLETDIKFHQDLVDILKQEYEALIAFGNVKSGPQTTPESPETAAAKARLDVIWKQNEAIDIQKLILQDIANEEKQAADVISDKIKQDYSYWGSAQEQMDKAEAEYARKQETYDDAQIAAAEKRSEQIQFTIDLLSDMLGMLSSITDESSQAGMAMSNLSSALQSKSVGEGFAKFALTVIKDWITTSQRLKDLKVQVDIDKITASLERFTMQLDNANNSMSGDKASEYQTALMNLKDAGEQLGNTFNNLSKNKRLNWFRDFKIDFDSISMTELQDLLVKMEAIKSESTDKKETKINEQRIEQLREMINLKQQELDIENKIREAVTGTTAESITDAIMQGFEDGYSTVADFGKTFEDTMRKAILNGFKMKMIEPAMNRFFIEFAKAQESGGEITEKEKNDLKLKWDGWMAQFTTGAEAIDQMFSDWGFDSASATQNTLSGSIKGITEDTADVLAGTMNSMRLNGIQQLQVAQSGLMTLQKIADNTFQIGRTNQLLANIEGKMGNSLNRASGR